MELYLCSLYMPLWRGQELADASSKKSYQISTNKIQQPKRMGRSDVPRDFVRGGGSTNSVEDREQRERESGGGSPLVRGSGGSFNLVQEISFLTVFFF